MAFTIRLYEKDRMLFTSIVDRLKKSFPNAYIRDGSDPTGQQDENPDGSVRYLYDDLQFDAGSFPAGAVPLRSGTWIDLKPVLAALSALCPREEPDTSGSSFHILFPLAYIEERESFIDSYFEQMRDSSDIPVRIDLMSAMRMAGDDRTPGSLTSLLKAASSPSFPAEKIPEYLNPGAGGYLIAGLPEYPDDVFDLGIDTVLSLISKLKDLCGSRFPSFFVLAVAEGFRTQDMCRICSESSNTHILLPSRMNGPGMDDAVGLLKRSSPDGKISIHYAEDLRLKKTS